MHCTDCIPVKSGPGTAQEAFVCWCRYNNDISASVQSSFGSFDEYRLNASWELATDLQTTGRPKVDISLLAVAESNAKSKCLTFDQNRILHQKSENCDFWPKAKTESSASPLIPKPRSCFLLITEKKQKKLQL